MWQHTEIVPGQAQAVPGILLQLLAWVDRADRSYEETMECWRTSCPRLSVWEDAVDAGLVAVDAANATGFAKARVRLTGKGSDLLGNGGLRRPDERV